MHHLFKENKTEIEEIKLYLLCENINEIKEIFKLLKNIRMRKLNINFSWNNTIYDISRVEDLKLLNCKELKIQNSVYLFNILEILLKNKNIESLTIVVDRMSRIFNLEILNKYQNIKKFRIEGPKKVHLEMIINFMKNNKYLEELEISRPVGINHNDKIFENLKEVLNKDKILKRIELNLNERIILNNNKEKKLYFYTFKDVDLLNICDFDNVEEINFNNIKNNDLYLNKNEFFNLKKIIFRFLKKIII
jgi:hypothetical protein